MSRPVPLPRRDRSARKARSGSRASPPEAFVRRFDACFELVHAEIRARADEATAQRLTARVLRAHLDLLAVGLHDPDAAPPALDARAVARLRASALRACGEESSRTSRSGGPPSGVR